MALARASRTSRSVLSSASGGGASSGNQRRSGDSSLGRAVASAGATASQRTSRWRLGCPFGHCSEWMSRSTGPGRRTSPSIPLSSTASRRARGLEVRVAGLAVPAHLEPAADLRVEREQGAGAGRVHDERAAGQVAVGARTPHRVLVAGEVVEELPAHRVLIVVRRRPTRQERDRGGVEGVGGHGRHGGPAYGWRTVEPCPTPTRPASPPTSPRRAASARPTCTRAPAACRWSACTAGRRRSGSSGGSSSRWPTPGSR